MYTQISMEHHNKRRNQLINRIFPLYAVEPGRRKLRIRKRIYMRKIARKTLDQERLQCRPNKAFLGPRKAKCQQLGPECLPNCPSVDPAMSGEVAGQLVLV